MLDDYISAFKNLFQGRENCFAMQLDNGEYKPYNFGIRDNDIESHLFYKTDTYAMYTNRLDNTVMLCCIDIDVDKKPLVEAVTNEGEKGIARLLEIVKIEAKKQSKFLTDIGLPHAVEFSGRRGYHIWMFFDRPIPAYYIVKLGEKIVLKRNKVITSPEHFDEQYEFVPKQAFVSLEDKGSQIKMPLGLHRVTKNYCHFVDQETFDQIDKQFEYLVWLDNNGRVKSENLEKVINEKIDYDLNNKDQEVLLEANQTFKKHSHSKSAYNITIPEEQSFKKRLQQMVDLIKPYNPYVKNYDGREIPSKEPIDEHIIKCPPCIYEVYKRSLYNHKEYEARTIIVRFFASKGYSPEDIAGFFYYHINDADDRKHEDILRYQVAYYYGDRAHPAKLDSCRKLQEKGYCINFGFKKMAQTRLLNDLIKVKDELKQKQKIIDKNKRDIVFFRQDFIDNPNNYDGINLEQEITKIEQNSMNLEREIIVKVNNIAEIEHNSGKKLDSERINEINKIREGGFNVICQRVWNPNSRHDELKQLKKSEFEDRLSYMNEKKESLFESDLGKEAMKDNRVVDIEIGMEKPIEESKNDEKQDDNNEDDGKIDLAEKLESETIELTDGNSDDKKKNSPQCWSQEAFGEINRKATETIDRATKTKEKMIHVIHKTTRAGVTTSLILNSFKLNQKVVLVAPTNNIGRDTFGHVIKISEEMHQCGDLDRPIYGANFASNDKMCLSLYEKIYVELPEEKQLLVKDLKVCDLPFLFKTSCVKKVSGTDIYCPYYSCIHIGYPKDSEGNVTPLVMSNVPKKINTPFCTQFHHRVQPEDTCFHKERLEFEGKCGDCRNEKCKKDKALDSECIDPNLFNNTKCAECRYFDSDYEYYEPNSRPICAYATILRHLIQDDINIQILNTNVITPEQLQQDHSGKIVYMSREEVKQQIEEGFIPVSDVYCDERGELKDDVNMIFRVRLKRFDALTLTYTKIRALYQSVENIKLMGRDDVVSFSEEIINAIRNGYNGIVCDEVSHLVAQPSLQFNIFSILRNMTEENEEGKELNFFDIISQEINEISRNVGTTRELENLDYFNVLQNYFVDFFKDVKSWVFSPSRIAELHDANNMELRQLRSDLNKVALDRENTKNPVIIKGLEEKEDQINSDIQLLQDRINSEPDEKKNLDYENVVKRIYRNDIPDEIRSEIQRLQNTDKLIGIETKDDLSSGRRIRKNLRPNVRFINSFEIRIKMRKIRKSIRKYNNEPDDDEPDSIFSLDTSDQSFYKRDIDNIAKINNESDYEQLIKEYKQLKEELTIKNNEIAIVNEIVMDFDDQINEYRSIKDIGEFKVKELFPPKTFVVIGWCRVNSRLLLDCFTGEGHKNRLEVDEIFFNMYNYLTNIAIKYNIEVSCLASMLLLANSDSFFINSFTTNEFKTVITLQTMPSFNKIVDLVRSIVFGKNNTKDKDGNELNNYAIATDATMPLIDMSTVFCLPTRVWKFGDPKHTCDKQIIITDTHTYNVKDLYGKISNVKFNLGNDATKRFDNPAKYHILERKNGVPSKVVDISKYLIFFRVLLFINSVCEEYGTQNVFIISPNKPFNDLITKGITSGVELNPIFVEWLQANFPKDFEFYLQKEWIKSNKKSTDDKTEYSFFVVKIGDLTSGGDRQYYRGNRTIGTSSNCRVMIAITPPSSPVNSCDWLSHFYYEKNYLSDKNTVIGNLTTSELSKALRKVELQSSMFQTISRVKDPQGNDPSVVFMYGVTSGDYNWIKCELCDRNELQIYNINQESFYDSGLGINSDDIYLCEFLYRGELVRKDLCYDCIKRYNAKIVGISDKRKSNITDLPKHIEDYLAFRIPTPKIIATPSVNNNTKTKSILDNERRMLDNARLFLNGKPLPPHDILRMKEQLILKTIDVIRKFKIDTTAINQDQFDEFLTFPVKDLTFRIGKKTSRIFYKKLEDIINDYGKDNLELINIRTINKGKKIHKLQLISLNEIQTKI